MPISPDRRTRLLADLRDKGVTRCTACGSGGIQIGNNVVRAVGYDPNSGDQDIALLPVWCTYCAHVMLFNPVLMG